MNNFEKKPMKGGTPAIENSNIVTLKSKKLSKLKLLNECNVLNWVKTVLNISQNKVSREELYMNM